MKKIAVVIALLLSCTNEEGAHSALTAAGFSNINLTGHAMFECSDSDSTCTGFTATGPTGIRVKGAVGCGYSGGCGKGCTIRTGN